MFLKKMITGGGRVKADQEASQELIEFGNLAVLVEARHNIKKNVVRKKGKILR